MSRSQGRPQAVEGQWPLQPDPECGWCGGGLLPLPAGLRGPGPEGGAGAGQGGEEEQRQDAAVQRRQLGHGVGQRGLHAAGRGVPGDGAGARPAAAAQPRGHEVLEAVRRGRGGRGHRARRR